MHWPLSPLATLEIGGMRTVRALFHSVVKRIISNSLLTQPWFHNSCTLALLGGDISKPMKGTGSNPL